MGIWTLDDIPWSELDRSKVDPEILRTIKAASLVEQNGADYAQYLCNVFYDDPEFQEVARRWGEEEIQHGQALGRWAMLVDPDFDHAKASERFTRGFRVKLDVRDSVRGTRSGELLARCIVETGTSSYYTALGEATDEPVLKAICQRIAADEFRHYKLFYSYLKRYLRREHIGLWERLRVAAGRLVESEDEELSYAYYAANENAAAFDHRRYNNAYAQRVYTLYRKHHIERGMAMIFKAVGLKPNGRLNLLAARIAWAFMHHRAERLERRAA